MADSPEHEDARKACELATTLSGHLMTAGLAVLALGGTASVFILTYYTVRWWFYPIVVIMALAFIVSVYFGGRGIRKITANGQKGSWSTGDSHLSFNGQAWLCVVGLVFFFLLPLGNPQPKKDDALKEISQVRDHLQKLETDLAAIRCSTDSSVTSIAQLDSRVRDVEILLARKGVLRQPLRKDSRTAPKHPPRGD